MKIPKSFALHGHTYSVTIVPASHWKIEDAVAVYISTERRIEILKRRKELMEQAFMHELMHAVFDAMGEDKLFRNERVVDLTASLLHQAFTTSQ